MANITQSSATSAGFIPQIWLQNFLDVLRGNLIMPKLVTTDSDLMGGSFTKGNQLNIPYPGTFAAQAKAPNTAATVQTPSNASEITVSLTQHETVDFIIEDIASVMASQDLMNPYMESAALAIAQQVETDLFSTITSITGGQLGTAGTNLTAAIVASARKQLNNNKIKMNDRYLVVSPKDEIALIQDSNLANYFAFSRPDAINQGTLNGTPLYGFKSYMSQYLPSLTADQQVVTLGSPTAGNFTLTYGAQTTANIVYNATAAAVQSALVALSSIGTGNVSVTGSAGGPYTVEFIGTLSENAAALTGSGAGLTSGTFSIANGVATSKNLAFQKEAILFVTRPLPRIPAGNGVDCTIIQDPETGIIMRMQTQYNIQQRGLYIALDMLYGFTALRPLAGVVLDS